MYSMYTFNQGKILKEINSVRPYFHLAKFLITKSDFIWCAQINAQNRYDPLTTTLANSKNLHFIYNLKIISICNRSWSRPEQTSIL